MWIQDFQYLLQTMLDVFASFLVLSSPRIIRVRVLLHQRVNLLKELEHFEKNVIQGDAYTFTSIITWKIFTQRRQLFIK